VVPAREISGSVKNARKEVLWESGKTEKGSVMRFSDDRQV